MVTRTYETMTVKVKCYNLDSDEVCERVFQLPKVIKDTAKLEKEVVKQVQTSKEEKLAFINIIDFEVNACLRGMNDEEFLKHSFVLDPATRKPYKSDAE